MHTSSSSYEVEYDLKNPYIPIQEEIISLLDGGGDAADNEHVEEVDNVHGTWWYIE